MRARCCILVALTCVLGCVGSEHPLSEPAAKDEDRQLYGTWRTDGAGTNEHRFLEFAPPGADTPRTALPDQKVMTLAGYTTAKGDGERYSQERSRAFLTVIAGKTFLNVHPEPQEGVLVDGQPGKSRPDGFFFYLCRIEGDRLDLTPMDTHAAARAVRRGLIEGEVNQDEDGPSTTVLLKSSSKSLSAFMATPEGVALFPEPGRIRYGRVTKK